MKKIGLIVIIIGSMCSIITIIGGTQTDALDYLRYITYLLILGQTLIFAGIGCIVYDIASGDNTGKTIINCPNCGLRSLYKGKNNE